MYYFTVVNYTKIQFGNSSRHKSYGEKPVNVNYETVIDKFPSKKNIKTNFKLHFYFIFCGL